MSDVHDYIAGSISEYLRHELSLEDFRVAFASTYFHARQDPSADKKLHLLMNRLIGPFGEFAAGHRSEDSLRLELANAARPVATPQSWAFEVGENASKKIFFAGDDFPTSRVVEFATPIPVGRQQDLSLHLGESREKAA
jgi:hypothetical protein